MTDSLRIKVDIALKLLKSTCRDKEVELSYSGGKDSDVILELAKMAGINYKAIYIKIQQSTLPGQLDMCERIM